MIDVIDGVPYVSIKLRPSELREIMHLVRRECIRTKNFTIWPCDESERLKYRAITDKLLEASKELKNPLSDRRVIIDD